MALNAALSSNNNADQINTFQQNNPNPNTFILLLQDLWLAIEGENDINEYQLVTHK